MKSVRPPTGLGSSARASIATAVALASVAAFVAIAIATSVSVGERRAAVEQHVARLRELSALSRQLDACGPERDEARAAVVAIGHSVGEPVPPEEGACGPAALAADDLAVAALERQLRRRTGQLSAELGDDVDRLFWVAIAACVVALVLGAALLDGLRLRRLLASQAVALQHQALETEDRERTLRRNATVIAHEISNPLLYLQLTAEHARRQPSGERSRTDLLEAALEAADRIGAVTQDLRDLGRQLPGESEDVDAAAVAQRARRLFGAGARARLVSEVTPVPPVRANAARLGQVILNLLRNADDASIGTTDPHIELTVRSQGSHVEIAVRDHGSGIPEEIAGLLFTPFVTSKGAAGTGLGLHLSRTIVESFGGTLTLENAADGGAIARVLLPTPAASS